jgi:uncharacterized protein YutE (UPF0331/DUF86 family)
MTREQLKDQCDAEFENIQAVLDELSAVVRSEKSTYTIVELAAIAAFLHNSYNGIENILKRILYYKDVKLHPGATWHKDLLKAAAKAGIISSELHDTLSGYLSFRHFFVHAYTFTLQWDEIKPLIERIDDTLKTFKASVYEYIEKSG